MVLGHHTSLVDVAFVRRQDGDTFDQIMSSHVAHRLKVYMAQPMMSDVSGINMSVVVGL